MRYVLAILVCLCPFVAATSDDGLVIPDSHPRIYWSADRLARARTWYKANPFTPTTNTGSINFIYDQLLKYIVSGDKAQCKTAINWALAQTIPESSLQTSVSFDAARWKGEQIILTYDWCYDQWSTDQRSELIDRWNHYFTAIMAKPWGGPSMPSNNYFWGYLRNEFLWAIATKDDNPSWQSFLEFSLNTRWGSAFLPYSLNAGRGGVATEGTEYGPAMGVYMAVPLDTAQLLGRDMLSETNWYREFIYALIYLTTPAPTGRLKDGATYYQIAPWADCCDRESDGYYPSAATYLWDSAMRTLAARYSAIDAGKHARWWIEAVNNKDSYYKHIRAVDPGGASAPFTSLPTDYFAAGPQFFSTRSSWDPSTAWALVQAGNTVGAGHGHHDSGSFQFWYNGRWLSKESTGYSNHIRSYSGNVASSSAPEAHNTLLFNGAGQAGSYPDGQPVTLRLQSGANESYIAVDLQNDYRSHSRDFHGHFDNPYVKTVIREMLLVKPMNTLVIFDRVESQSDVIKGDTSHSQVDPASVPKTFLLHTEYAPAVSGNVVTARSGDSVLKLTVLAPAAPAIRIVNEGDVPTPDAGYPYQYRVEIEDSGSPQSYFLNVLQAESSGGRDVVATVLDEGGSYRVTLALAGAGTAVIEFNKGMVSNGGAFGFASSGTPTLEPLSNGVQVMQVTDSGPVWSEGRQRPVRPPSKNH